MNQDIPPLDEYYYALKEDELNFFKKETRIENEDELKAHIIAVQAKAYEIFPYPCIRRFSFTNLKISRLPAYKHVLQLGKERDGALLLDIGCCFGNDARKAVADGFPVKNVIASDLHPEYLQLGLELFKSNPESYPIKFLPGDAFDSSFLAPGPPLYQTPDSPAPSLDSLTTLSSLHGRISAIHASSFFHLFTEDKQHELAQRLASLLSPLPGSIIFGTHFAQPDKGGISLPVKDWKMFCHSPDSWRELWNKVFKEGTVCIDAYLKEVEPVFLSGDTPIMNYFMIWSVTRL